MCCFFHCVWHLYSIQMRRCSVMINQPCTSSTYIQSVSLKITSTPIFAQHSHTLIFTSLCTWCSHFFLSLFYPDVGPCYMHCPYMDISPTSPHPPLQLCGEGGGDGCGVGGMVVGRGGDGCEVRETILEQDSCRGHFIFLGYDSLEAANITPEAAWLVEKA